ncbi:nucleotidyltransferase [Sphingomonas sp. Leaf230]|uniref:HEPN domain-containing protein n=1 Tax=Sphingomonas sp. Leaf230 TaxID=1735694 RepID=UPI0006F65390|nr:HEPN domain-containing protein [Sphingomonas sp. Leaf230]KQN01170.1 nucleotidyltransferase [Sphingomonas sp. Leaf230]
MKPVSALEDLPPAAQRELQAVVRILFEEFEARLRGTTKPSKKAGRILKLVLYGSYARGDWVDDPIGGYRSDYDILVIVNDEQLTDVVDYWAAAEDRLVRDVTITHTLSAPVNFIVHSLTDLNKQLERGRPFFVDIARDGIALYEAEGFGLATPTKLPSDEARAEAQKHFDHWFPLSLHAEKLAEVSIADGVVRDAAFLFHQAAERAYHCVLLVLSLYSPKSHKLMFLRSRCEQVDQRLVAAWPRETKFERRCFELLRQAYVNARYSPHYAITDEELAWLGQRVRALQGLVEQICLERLQALA